MSLIEALKALGRPIDTCCKLIEALLGEPFKAGGDLLADQVKYWQWSNRVRILDRVDEKMRSRSLHQRKLEPDFLLPYIDKAGNVSNDSLQEAWARLLVAAIEDKSNECVSFISVLQDLSATDVKALDSMIKLGFIDDTAERRSAIASDLGLPEAEVSRSLANLARLGFFTPTQRAITVFGTHFLRACVSDASAIDRYLEEQKARGRKVIMD